MPTPGSGHSRRETDVVPGHRIRATGADPADILPSSMSHLANDRKLLSRIRRIKGQVEGLERAVLQGEDCYHVLQQTAAARGALNGLVAELIESHLRFHTLSKRSQRKRTPELDEVMTVIRSYLG